MGSSPHSQQGLPASDSILQATDRPSAVPPPTVPSSFHSYLRPDFHRYKGENRKPKVVIEQEPKPSTCLPDLGTQILSTPSQAHRVKPLGKVLFMSGFQLGCLQETQNIDQASSMYWCGQALATQPLTLHSSWSMSSWRRLTCSRHCSSASELRPGRGTRRTSARGP